MSEDRRRGSSIFSGAGAGAGESNAQGGAPQGGGAVRRSSSVLQPGALGGIGFGIDFDDSDYDDSDDEDEPPAAVPSGQAGAPTGGPNHRPYVGGFAAAAYEAARMHHTQNTIKQQQKEQQQKQQQSKSSSSQKRS